MAHQTARTTAIYTVMPDADDSPLFIQGDEPNQWFSASYAQRRAIDSRGRQSSYVPPEPTTSGDGKYAVDDTTITSLHGKKVARLYVSNYVPYGRHFAHGGARAAAAPK